MGSWRDVKEFWVTRVRTADEANRGATLMTAGEHDPNKPPRYRYEAARSRVGGCGTRNGSSRAPNTVLDPFPQREKIRFRRGRRRRLRRQRRKRLARVWTGGGLVVVLVVGAGVWAVLHFTRPPRPAPRPRAATVRGLRFRRYAGLRGRHPGYARRLRQDREGKRRRPAHRALCEYHAAGPARPGAGSDVTDQRLVDQAAGLSRGARRQRAQSARRPAAARQRGEQRGIGRRTRGPAAHDS